MNYYIILGLGVMGYLPFIKTIRLEISSINIKQLNATLRDLYLRPVSICVSVGFSIYGN